jgi:hypothetical protein
MRRTTRTAALVAVLVATVSLLAACSNDDNSVSTSGTTTTSNEPITTSSGPCALAGATPDTKSGGTASSDVSLLTAVRTGRRPCADRITFEFRDGAPPEYTVEYQPGPFELGESGMPLTVQGSSFLVVRFPHSSGVDLNDPTAPATYTGPDSIIPTGLAHAREVRKFEDFEAVLQWVIGLDGTRPFTVGVLDGPPRVYIDIG